MTKRIHHNSILGERGINAIQAVVLEMGFVFYPTGGVEAGIDGYIEIRDDQTGIVSNLILQVQGKATERPFAKETDDGFEFPCSEDDIRYWRDGTAPVILVVVRTTDGTAYWKSIKDYFADAAALHSRRVVFDKGRDVFNRSAKAALLSVAASVRPGAVLPPVRFAEALTLNLMPVEHMGPRLFLAETGHKDNKSFGAALRSVWPDAPAEWIVKGRRVLSFHDLGQNAWRRVCDQGTVEDFDISEWADSDDEDRVRDLVQLLNRGLSQFVRPELYSGTVKGTVVCHFRKPRSRDRLSYDYEGVKRTSARNVVRHYPSKGSRGGHGYFRHSAFEGRFVRLGAQWCLEVTPTYVFSEDGVKPLATSPALLKGIKEMENNAAVFGQLMMWQHFLARTTGSDLLRQDYPFLRFGQLLTQDVDRGVPDDLWRGHEEKDREGLFTGEGPEL